MIHVLIIVPYPELFEKMSQILGMPKYKDTLDATVQLVNASKVEQVNSSGYDLIIARGYSAITLARTQSLPVLPLPITTLDILHAIMQCRNTIIPHPRKIGCIGLIDDWRYLNTLTDVLNIPIYVSVADSYQDLGPCIDLAVENGCDAIIGGYSAFLLAQEREIPSFFIHTGEEAIMQVLDNAIHVIEAANAQQLHTEMYKTVIQAATNAILYVDHQEMIVLENPHALTLTQKKSLRTRPLEHVLPLMYPSCHQVFQNGKAIFNEILRLYDHTISADYIPIQIRNQVDGVLISFQDITQIQKQEATIRKSLSEKGLLAKYSFSNIIHKSSIMNETIEKARRYAATSSNIMLLGESGTGKELFAQSIHNCSQRKDGPFVAINCAALPENLLESELFGYAQGTFTGANKGGKTGLFELAHGGTLFLDEISEVSINMQSKLLRVLQEHEIRRIGDDKVISINVRIICATNQNLKKLVSEGRFRQDLLYRLDVLRIFLPPLRRRDHDVLLIFDNMLQDNYSGTDISVPDLTPDAQNLLLQTPFPGNIRELRNVAERISILHTSPEPIDTEELKMALEPEDIDLESESYRINSHTPAILASPVSDEMSKIQQALKECNGNQTKAAKMLGIDRSTLWRKLKKYHAQEQSGQAHFNSPSPHS